jgi:hypothetical protein
VYLVEDLVDVPITITGSTATFDFAYCTTGTLSFTTRSTLTEASVPTPLVHVPVPPTGPVADIVLGNTGAELSWTTPVVLTKCDTLQYTVNVEGDLPDSSHPVPAGAVTYTIPEAAYCFRATAQVTGVIDAIEVASSNEVNHVSALAPPADLALGTPTATGQLTASWTAHAKPVECGIVYTAVYLVEDLVDVPITITGSTATFDLAYCTTGTLTFTISSTFTGDSVPTPLVHGEVNPTGPVASIVLGNTGAELSWTTPVVLTKCDTLQYTVNVEGDLPASSYPVPAGAVTYTIPEAAYCFTATAHVTGVIDAIEVASSNDVNHVSALTAPEEVLLRAVDNNAVATWTPHTKQGLCDIQYEVQYVAEGNVISTTSDAESPSTFDIEYCATLSITVTASSRYSSISPSDDSEITTGDPTNIGPVRDIEMVIDGVDAELGLVAWSAPNYMAYCAPVEHNVVATNGALEDTCTGENSCSITLTTFCPDTIFTIQRTDLLGEVGDYTYYCNPELAVNLAAQAIQVNGD